MPTYEINHVLLGPGPTTKVDPAKVPAERKVYKPGDLVTESELVAAGFDIDRLRTKKEGGFSAAVTIVRGTERTVDPPVIVQSESPSAGTTSPPADAPDAKAK